MVIIGLGTGNILIGNGLDTKYRMSPTHHMSEKKSL